MHRAATAGIFTVADALENGYPAGSSILVVPAAAAATITSPPPVLTSASQNLFGNGAGVGGLDDSSSALSKGAVDPALLGGGIAAGVFLLVLVALLVYAVFYTHDNVAGISEDRDADRRASMGVMLQDGPQSLHFYPGTVRGNGTAASGNLQRLSLVGGGPPGRQSHYWPGGSAGTARVPSSISLAGASIMRRPTALGVAGIQRAYSNRNSIHSHVSLGGGGGGSNWNSAAPVEEEWVTHDNEYRDIAAKDEFNEAQDEYIGIINQLGSGK